VVNGRRSADRMINLARNISKCSAGVKLEVFRTGLEKD
jgi:hypothetical protein